MNVKEFKELLGNSNFTINPEPTDTFTKETCFEIGFRSDAGEDFSLSVWADNFDEFVENFVKAAEDFDENDHIATLIGYNGSRDIIALSDESDKVGRILEEIGCFVSRSDKKTTEDILDDVIKRCEEMGFEDAVSYDYVDDGWDVSIYGKTIFIPDEEDEYSPEEIAEKLADRFRDEYNDYDMEDYVLDQLDIKSNTDTFHRPTIAILEDDAKSIHKHLIDFGNELASGIAAKKKTTLEEVKTIAAERKTSDKENPKSKNIGR